MAGLTLEQLQKKGAVKKGEGVSLESLQTPQPTEDRSFGERFSEDIQKRGATFSEGAERESLGQQTRGETVLQAVGQGSGLVFDFGGELLSSAIKLIPDFIKDPLKEKGKEILDTPIGQAGINAISKGVGVYEEWKSGNPRAAANLESAVNIGLLLPGAKGGQVAGEAGLKATGKVAGKVATSAEKRLSKQLVDEALDVIKPQLTKLEKQQALEAGRGTVSSKILPRKFEKVSLLPSKQELKIAEELKGVVKKSKNPIDNISAIDQEIGKLARLTETGLVNNNTIFNKNHLKAFLNKTKEESRVVFGTDKALQNSYDAVIDEMIKQSTKTKGNLGGLLEARKNFDNVINQKFPKLLSSPVGDVTKKNAVLDVRRAVNEFIESKLPEGNQFKELLKKQTLMYQGRKNIAKKTASLVDSSITKRAMSALRQNPLVGGITGGILTFAALTGLLSNPLVLGTLVLGGSVKFGKSVITSKTLKRILIEAANAIENGSKKLGSKEGASALRQIADKIQDAPMGLSIKDVSKGKSAGFGTKLSSTPKPKTKLGSKPTDISSSISKAKASGQSFDEWVKGQETVYHGTKAKFDDFDFLLLGKASGETPVHNLKGAWFVDNKSVAGGYGKNIKENIIDTSNFHKVNAEGKTLNDFRDEIWEAKKYVSENKKSGLIIENLIDNKDFSKSDIGKHIFVVDKSKIKTRSQLKAEWDRVGVKKPDTSMEGLGQKISRLAKETGSKELKEIDSFYKAGGELQNRPEYISTLREFGIKL